MLTDPERLDDIESAVNVAAERLAALDDAAGEAKAHTVRAGCLARLGRIGDCETALDQALTAARRARDHSRVNAVLAGAPLAALWGPNPVPRAGGRCLDVVRLLRITTGSPLVEATSTRCQAVLDALRGRAAEGRRLIESARRTLTELGLRHALLEVDQFAGIIELVADDPAAAEPYLRRAYEGLRRMGLDTDTADTAVLLARACLVLDRDTEADELCAESERLAGHGSKASIAWRTVRAQLLARAGAHDRARQIAEEAVGLAGATDALVDHGDACLALATVLRIAGDTAGMRAAAEQAVTLYDRKGAAALAEKARKLLNASAAPRPSAVEQPVVELSNTCVEVGQRVIDAINRQAWEEFERLFASEDVVESRRKIVGFTRADLQQGNWAHQNRHIFEASGDVRITQSVVAVRGDRLALSRLFVGSTDSSLGAPQDEFLQIYGIDHDGRVSLQVWFDPEDLDAALAELNDLYGQREKSRQRSPLENTATRTIRKSCELFAGHQWDEITRLFAGAVRVDDRRRGLHRVSDDRATEVANLRELAALGVAQISATPLALRGNGLALSHLLFQGRDTRPEAFATEVLALTEVDDPGLITAMIGFDHDDFDAAIAELDARYSAGEAQPFAQTWSVVTELTAAFNLHEYDATDCPSIDHRRVMRYAGGDLTMATLTQRNFTPDLRTYIEVVHRLSDRGVVTTNRSHGIAPGGFEAEWRVVNILLIEGDELKRFEVFDEADIDAALKRFDQLTLPATLLENAASRTHERMQEIFANRDWDAAGELLSEDASVDDRRRVVNTDIRQGRDATMASMRAGAELGARSIASVVLAVRGDRLALLRTRYAGRDPKPEAFHMDDLTLVEIDTDNRLRAGVIFDLDDFDAAIAELDARYIGGEAAPYARAWSVIAGAYASVSRRKRPAMTPNAVSVDWRRGAAFETDGLMAYIRGGRELELHAGPYVETVHRLNDLGAVVTYASKAGSDEGFEAEWREVTLSTVDGDLIDRCELFDEADLETALARFDELSRQAHRLENGATRVSDRLYACFAARDWAALADLVIDDFEGYDRRQVVNVDLHGRDAMVESFRSVTNFGDPDATTAVLATRGSRLALTSVRYAVSDGASDAFHVDLLQLVEIDAAERIASLVTFDLDDTECALEELDTRYMSGEASSYAQTWAVIVRGYAGLNHNELAPTTPDWVNVDHRRLAPVTAGRLGAYIRTSQVETPDIDIHIAAVHRISELGAVVTRAVTGTSREGFYAEWREIDLVTVEGELVSRCEIFDEADLDVALAEFDELNQSEPRLNNAASQSAERFRTCFARHDWDAARELLAADCTFDDRRQVVNGSLLRGPDDEIANLRVMADLGVDTVSSEILAIRGERLALSRTHYFGSDDFRADVLDIVEIDAEGRLAAYVTFDADGFDAAFEEFETRYVAGEAAGYAGTWAVVAGIFTSLARHEIPPSTADWSTIDHRRGTPLANSDLREVTAALWDLTPDLHNYIEEVHRLGDKGALVTQVSRGTTAEGFPAEWRMLNLITVDGPLVSGCELFDEDDLDAALARFEELSQPVRRLENAASREYKLFNAHYTSGNWDGLAQTMADDFYADDRRRVVGAGGQQGRDAAIAHARVTGELGVNNWTSAIVAVRGERLALLRSRFWGRDERPGAFDTEVLHLIEINAELRLTRFIALDVDDIDSAFAELEARYLAGEASAHAHTWSVIAGAYAAVLRHELPPTTPDWVNVDHRRVTSFAPNELEPFLKTAWDVLNPDIRIHVETVRRLTDTGAVVTRVIHGTSREGFSAEWREIGLSTIEGDRINRSELFDEADLDAALARFDELSTRGPNIENNAGRVDARFWERFATRDWDAISAVISDDICIDDRRRVVNAGVQRGRDAHIADLRAIAEAGAANTRSTVIATRGERLALTRVRSSMRGLEPEESSAEVLSLLEVDADNRIVARVGFDVDDIDAAFAELDTRFLAGEAARYAEVWSGIAEAYTMFNRHEVPRVSNWETVDHRVRETFAAEDLAAYIRSGWDVTPDNKMYIECVHRLNDRGAVLTHTAFGRWPEGFYAEWRMIALLTIGDTVTNRCDLFEEADLDIAIAKFDELGALPRRPENAATRALARAWACFDSRDWEAMQQVLTEDFTSYDHRQVVNAGVRRGRAIHIENMQSVAEVGFKNIGSAVIATRGERLALCRSRFAARGVPRDEIAAEALLIVETDAANRLVSNTVFDNEDIAVAFADLDARYTAGEAAAHLRTWSVVTQAYTALNRHENFERDWIFSDHRRGTPFASDVSVASRHAAVWDVMPDRSAHIEVVHRLGDAAVLLTAVTRGTSPEGFDVEWRFIKLLTVTGGSIDRCELFDEADLDAAIARLNELTRPAPRLDNAAVRVRAYGADAYNRRDAKALLARAMGHYEDHRKGLRDEGAMDRKFADALLSETPTSWQLEVEPVALRGDRLALTRETFRDSADASGPVTVELMVLTDVAEDEVDLQTIFFDTEDVDAAFVELERLYVAGEAAAHAHTWSVITQAYAAFNRREIPATTPAWADHRLIATIEADDLIANLRAAWDIVPDVTVHIAMVHRLNERGAVVEQVVKGSSKEGFPAEYRELAVVTVDGDRTDRFEMFDEEDLDAALTRFNELNQAPLRTENAATWMWRRLATAFNHHDVDEFLALTSADGRIDDRRRGLQALHGSSDRRKAAQALFETPLTWRMDIEHVATRGTRLSLARLIYRDTADDNRPITVELLAVVEINDDGLMDDFVNFDSDDLDAAFAELEARYLAGEAAPYCRTWSTVADGYAAFNRRELFNTTPDWVNIDHRRGGTSFAPGEQIPLVSATWDVVPKIRAYAEVVHRLDTLGAVVTQVVKATSQEGFDGEWRELTLLTVDGDALSRCEVFDEADLDAALARFDDLCRPAHQLVNAATLTRAQLIHAFDHRDLDDFRVLITQDGRYDDRRKGLRSQGLLIQEFVPSMISEAPASWQWTDEPVAIRGHRLVLCRDRFRNTDAPGQPITVEDLSITEVTEDGLVCHSVIFDSDDLDAAMRELNARWIASGEVEHPEVIEAARRVTETTNRHDWEALLRLGAGAVYANHRQLSSPDIQTVTDHMSSIQAMASLVPDLWIEHSQVFTYSPEGLVSEVVVKGTSTNGFAIELPVVMLTLFDGDHLSRLEVFDSDQRSSALARFEELSATA
ncbi:putative ATPase [Mycolicibacterium flavescens]|nr:putative ATPase [Mycolicibacterium flavescens]